MRGFQPVRCGEARRSVAAECATPFRAPRPVARLARSLKCLVEERQRLVAAGAETLRPDAEIVVLLHGRLARKVRRLHIISQTWSERTLSDANARCAGAALEVQ